MITADPSRASLFHMQSDNSKGRQSEPYPVFERHLKRTDWLTQEMGARLLTAVLEARPDKASSVFATDDKIPRIGDESSSAAGSEGASLSAAEKSILTFVDWLTSQLRRPTHPTRYV